MRDYLSVEFITQYDYVFKGFREHSLGRVAVIPDMGLVEEIEPGALDDACLISGGLGTEEDGRSEDAFKGRNQSPILLTALGHAERLEHLRGRPEPNSLAPLTDSQRRQENRNEAILAEGQAEIGVTGDLESEKAIAPLVNESGTWRTSHRQAAEDKGSGGEPELLFRCLTAITDQLDTRGLAQLLPRNAEFSEAVLQNRARGFEARALSFSVRP